MDFREAHSQYPTPEPVQIYKNDSPLYIVATLEVFLSTSGATFSFGPTGTEIHCNVLQLASASFLIPPGKVVVGAPSPGAEVWINVATQVVDPAWVPQ